MSQSPVNAEIMQVRSTDLDQLLTLAGEVIIASSNQGLIYRHLQTMADQQQVVRRDMVETARDIASTMNEISGNLHHLVQSIRNVTLHDMMLRARRLVRDVSRRTGKRVRFEVEGEQTTVDKSIIEKLWDPLAHQLRNAVDHGLEDALTRQRAGKPEEGVVHIRAVNTERETIIEIEDDGRGVDMEKLQAKAESLGLITSGQSFTEEQALAVMCAPGFSTAENVSQVSGRGVGMDVVRNMLQELGGSLTFTTTPGQGTCFSFRVPIVSAVNIVDALVVRVGRHMFAVPIQNVVTTMAVDCRDINTTLGKGQTVSYLDQLVALHDMGRLMRRSPVADEQAEVVSVIIVEHKRRHLALRVSECLSPQKLVIIPFNEALEVDGLAGTTILGGRRLGFIVDPASLIQLADNNGRSLTRDSEPSSRGTAETSAGLPTAAAEASVSGQSSISQAAQSPEDQTATDTDTRHPSTVYQQQEGTAEEQAALIREYVAELDRMSPQVNAVLFDIEKDPEQQESLNLAFRLFHTLKGNLIMMGLPAAGETVHAVESLLDAVRSKQLEMSAEVMDLLMDGSAFIEQVAKRLHAGDRQDMPGQEIIDQSRQLLPRRDERANRPVGDVAALDYEFSHESAFREKSYRRRRMPFYQIVLEFDPGNQPAFLVAVLIYNRICQVADVLASVPRLTDLEHGLVEEKVKLLFASDRDPQQLESGLRDLLTTHYGVRQFQFSRYD